MSATPFRKFHLSGIAGHLWWICGLCALVLLGQATSRRIERVEALTQTPTWSVDAPARDATTPTGYERGQRRLIVPGHHGPSFWWIIEAQDSAHDGSWRLRQIDYDAMPDGREIRRTAPYRWWLIFLGWCWSVFSGEPLGLAIEHGALIADPLLLVVLVVGGVTYSARFLGHWAGVGVAIAGVSIFPLAANFQPGAPDSHSLAWLLALGSVLPLVVGSRAGDERSSRVHFLVAGVCGGLGFWNDAGSQGPLLLAVFVGALCLEWVRWRGDGRAQPAGHGWRAWAWSGAVTVLAASMFEFAPRHLSWVPDAVSPLHAVAWWGMGEVIGAVRRLARHGSGMLDRRARVLAVGGVLALAAWPVTAWATGSDIVFAAEFHARELANHPRGGVAANLKVWLSGEGDAGAKWATLLPCILWCVLLARIVETRTSREEKAGFLFVTVLLSFVAVLAWHQLRWWNLFDVLVLVAIAVLLAGAGGPAWRRLTVVLPALPGLAVGLPSKPSDGSVNDVTQLEAQALVARDFSFWLARRAGDEKPVVFSTPVFAGALAYYGGFGVVCSSDESHDEGLLAAVRIASAYTEQEIAALLHARGITHLALPRWDPMLDQLVRLGRNLPPGAPLPTDAFAVALQWWEVPLWMRPLDYLIPRRQEFEGFDLRAFALQAEQPADLGLARLAEFFVQRGQLSEAHSLRESLVEYPRSLVALGAIASVDLALRDRARLDRTLDSLVPMLSRRAARDLPVDRRIGIAAVLLQSGRTEDAREQLAASLDGLDVAKIREFTPATVGHLLAMSRALNMRFPREELRNEALAMLPPDIRASFAGE